MEEETEMETEEKSERRKAMSKATSFLYLNYVEGLSATDSAPRDY
jgi:hypothetical protein